MSKNQPISSNLVGASVCQIFLPFWNAGNDTNIQKHTGTKWICGCKGLFSNLNCWWWSWWHWHIWGLWWRRTQNSLNICVPRSGPFGTVQPPPWTLVEGGTVCFDINWRTRIYMRLSKLKPCLRSATQWWSRRRWDSELGGEARWVNNQIHLTIEILIEVV